MLYGYGPRSYILAFNANNRHAYEAYHKLASDKILTYVPPLMYKILIFNMDIIIVVSQKPKCSVRC